MTTTTTRPAAQAALALAALAAGVLLLLGGGELAALERAAGYAIGDANIFSNVHSYLAKVRDGLMPLALPLAGIGLAGGGMAYMVGNAMAQRILGGVVVGTAVVLTAPSIVA